MASGQGWWIKEKHFAAFSPVACFLTIKVASDGAVYQAIIAATGDELSEFYNIKSDGLSLIRKDMMERQFYHESEFEVIGEELK